MYGILNEVLDIRYLDKNNEYQTMPNSNKGKNSKNANTTF